MITALGTLATFIGGLLYAGQLISSIDFALAQRLGLQEKADGADPLVARLELGTARWDLLSLWTLPMAGVLMLLGDPWWPCFGLIGGAVAADTGGREAAKVLGLLAHGVRFGATRDVRLAFGAYAFFLAIGVAMITASLAELL